MDLDEKTSSRLFETLAEWDEQLKPIDFNALYDNEGISGCQGSQP